MTDDRSEGASVNIPAEEIPEDPSTGVQLGRRRTRFLEDGFDAGVKIQGMALSPTLTTPSRMPKKRC